MPRTKIRINVMVPAQLVDELKELAPPGERSSFIVAAMAKRIRTIKQQAAIAAAAGAWSDEDHPELKSEEDFRKWRRTIDSHFARGVKRIMKPVENAAHVPVGQ